MSARALGAGMLAIAFPYSRDRLAAMRFHEAVMGIRAVVFRDPEGYQLQIQSAAQVGA